MDQVALAQAVEKRSYSWISGQTAEESVTETPGRAAASNFSVRFSWESLAYECRKPIATAATFSCFIFSMIFSKVLSSKGVLASPFAVIRSATGKRNSRGNAKQLAAELERRRVVASSRPPDIIRFGLSPLYHRETDVRELVRRLENAFRGPY